MHRVRNFQTLLLTGALAVSPAFASHAHRSPTAGHSHKRKAAAHQIHGQRQIDADRAREIQSALVRANYLTGEATGEWNQQSQQAMQRYQADHHWQTKIIPDSRALISLGLGPNVDPSTLATVPAAPAQTAQAAPASQATAPAKTTAHSRTGASSALTLADAHSILN